MCACVQCKEVHTEEYRKIRHIETKQQNAKYTNNCIKFKLA